MARPIPGPNHADRIVEAVAKKIEEVDITKNYAGSPRCSPKTRTTFSAREIRHEEKLQLPIFTFRSVS